MTYDDDSILAKNIQKGDRGAFEVLLARYERQIFSFIYHFFRDRTLCEDLTQETFLRVYRFIGSFRPQEKLSTWIYSIAKNLCIDELRRLQKGGTVDIDAVDPELFASGDNPSHNPVSALVAAQEGEILKRIIAQLPEKYRTCIILFYFNEMSYEDISKIMNISLNNTKIILFRGKKMLLQHYRKEFGEL